VSTAAQHSAAAVREALSRVMARERIGVERAREKGLAERFFEWLADWLPDLPGMDPSALVPVLQWVLFAIAAVLLWRFVAARRRRLVAGARAVAPKEAVRRRVARLVLEARAAEAARDLSLALRLYLFALVVGHGECGDLEFRPAWTNRELLTRGHPSPEIAAELRALLDDLDPKVFGRAGVTPRDVERIRGRCEALLARAAA
jgi:hypothetical protein